MRIEASDHRDSAWERHETHFRVFLFEGADSAVTTFDIVEATVEQALEAARMLSEDNAKLWSLALVHDEIADGDAGPRGLVWLSGLDYHDQPETAHQWHLRGQMQNRYLSAAAQRGDAPLLPNGLRVIRLFPEWAGGLPLWESFTDHYRISPEHLDLSDHLSTALGEWNHHWLDRDETHPLPDAAAWRAEGWALYKLLQTELDGIAEVRPEFDDTSA